MGRLALAFKLFFKALFNRESSQRARELLLARPVPAPGAPAAAKAPAEPRGRRSEAVTLLAVLQREGRLIDFLKEDLGGYGDAQIGSAVRDIHRDCAAAIERLFAVRPISGEAEGAAINIPTGFDPQRIRLTGNVAGAGPYRGTLRHGGWEATKVEVPAWSGNEEAAKVVAAAEVEV